MKAVILVGGFGTRLQKVVSDKPKPLAPIAGKPFLEYQINRLKKQNIIDIVLCTGYLGYQIEDYFGDGSAFGVNIEYSKEDSPLGTAGAIKNAENFLKNEEEFLVLNGDTYAEIDFNKLIDFHKNYNTLISLSLNKSQEKERFGNVIIDSDNNVMEFREKDSKSSSNLINTGTYIFKKEILNLIPIGKKVSLETEIFPKILKKCEAKGYVWEGYHIDIGIPDAFHKFRKWILKSICIPKESSIRQVLASIDKFGLGTALVVDSKRKLLGLITDGDIRRFIIKQEDLHRPIQEIMIKNPVVANINWSKEKIKSLINPRIKHIPLIDNNGVLKDIILSADVAMLDEETSKGLVIRAKAPLRISFSGGGTDIYEYFKESYGYILSSSIDKYCKGTLVKRKDKKIIINSFDFNMTEKANSLLELKYNGKLDLIKSVIKLMKPEFGFELFLYSEVPPGSGLGSSASISAVVAGLINHLREEKLDDYELTELIYKAEREEIKIKGGWQDQYATVFGGFNFMEFLKEESIVYPLRIKKEHLDELNTNLFLCFTGKTRESGKIQETLIEAQRNKKENPEVLEALSRLKQITQEIKTALLKGKMEDFGKLLHECWENKKRSNKKISNSDIDKLYNIGIRNGVLGGKLLGAGGGGYILFFCSPLKRKKVFDELRKAGGKIINFNFDVEGLVTWTAKTK
tara:strand:- start:17935 stop:19998 length:2064 start_codon:yes stop_codon:yes gene_type:complete